MGQIDTFLKIILLTPNINFPKMEIHSPYIGFGKVFIFAEQSPSKLSGRPTRQLCFVQPQP
jgi:hypothetical protein